MEDTRVVEPLLQHEDESAGGIMSPYLVSLRPEMTTDNVLDYLRAVQPRTADPYYLYVVDQDQHLVGVVGLRDLVVARPETLMRDLMSAALQTTTTSTDQEEVLRTLQHYNLRALPVIDDDGRLVGVTTADDLLDVAEQEATEDMFRLVGMEETESLRGTVSGSVRRRFPWLLVNLSTVFAAAGVVAVFEDTLDRVAALAIFLPVVVAISANAGGQTLTLVVRAMALGEYAERDWRPAVRHEVAIGLIHGVALGLLVGLVAWAWKDSPYIGLAIGLAMAANLMVAAAVGVLVPTALRVARLDPALASSILVTSVTDIMGFFFYLGIAALLVERIA
jgi:magnesium transporter